MLFHFAYHSDCPTPLYALYTRRAVTICTTARMTASLTRSPRWWAIAPSTPSSPRSSTWSTFPLCAVLHRTGVTTATPRNQTTAACCCLGNKTTLVCLTKWRTCALLVALSTTPRCVMVSPTMPPNHFKFRVTFCWKDSESRKLVEKRFTACCGSISQSTSVCHVSSCGC